MQIRFSPVNDSDLAPSASDVISKHEGGAHRRRCRLWRMAAGTHPQEGEDRLRMRGLWEQNRGGDVDGT